MTDSGHEDVYLAVDNGISSGRRSYQTMTAVGLDAGDVDGDGTDEIVVGGTRNTVTSRANSADADTAYSLDGETWNIAVFNARSDGSFASPGTDDSATRFHSVASTGWFAGGTGGENNRSPLSVAFNGSIHEEYVFVGGKILDFSAGGANELYTVSFIKDNDDSVQSTVCDETFIPSVAVGNFDGNDYGYEQIFFVYANKQRNEDDYFYRLGAVGGKNYDGAGGGVGSAEGTDTSMFYEKSSGFFIGGNVGQGGAGADGHWEYHTNFVLVSMDRDDDGVLARYKGKEWNYTDPQVAAVLQMAPYFAGIDLGSDSGETSYAFTQSYEYTTGSGNETSFGVGFAMETETMVATVGLQAGSSNTWTETFEETLTTSTTDSFDTKAYDSVVLQRTPVFTYTYEIYNADKGGWSWDNLESEEDGEGFAISVPKTPVYVQMSVTDYDSFVDEYNAQVEEMAKAYEQETGQTITPEKMEKIGGQKEYLGQEGNPWGYASNLEQISSSTYQLGYNGGETQSSKSDGSAYTESFESSNGFSFELSIMAGFKLAGNGAQAGGYYSLEYMHSSSSSTTTASETETSGAVQNLDWRYLLEEYGIPENVTKSYGFTWNLARDTIQDLGVAGDDVPIITYNVTDITAPAPAVNDLVAELQGLDSVRLTWSKPQTDGRLNVTGYYVYVKGADDETFRKVNETAITNTEYTVTGLDSNTEYTFVVTTDSERGESVWSNEAVITTPKAYVRLNLEYNENQVSVKATHLGNVNIASGDMVEEETIVYVEVAPKPGYTVTAVTLTTEGGTQTVTPVDGQFNFAIQEATTITVTAAVVAESSTVTYTAEYENGTVSATVNGEAFSSTGATFRSDDELVFTAAPAEGYALKAWTVTDGSGTDKSYAAAGNTFTFHSYADEHHVSAVFVPLEDVAKIVTLDVTGGGTIVVKDGDTILTPDGDGKLTVPQGTTLTFEAVADQYYTFENWTGAFAGYQNDVTSLSLKIEDNVTVGTVFESFLAYTLTYDIQSVDGGSGTLSTRANGIAVNSGATLTPGTTVDFDAEAADGSRIQKWEITKNGITSFQELNHLGIITEDAYRLVLQANSNVEAAFKTIEKYDLTGSAFSGNGTVTVTRGDSDTVSSGSDVLRYYDDLTITLTPAKGYVIEQYPNLTGTDTYSYTVSDVTADVVVNYTWKALEQYEVAYSAVDTVGDGSGTHGTISAAAERKGMDLYADNAPSVVYEGGTITFTAAPDAGYRVKEWIVNGKVQSETGNTLTLIPMEDLVVTVQYTSGLPKVSFADPAHGTLAAKMGDDTIGSSVAVSAPVTFTVVPDENYEVKCWTVNGVEQPGETGNTFTYEPTADCTVAVELWRVEQDVVVQTGAGGTAAATDPARYGQTITITATPDAGYVVDAITVRGTGDVLYENTGKANGVQTAKYEITAATTFEITFSKKPAVTFLAANGSLTASGTADGAAANLESGDYVDFGSTVTFTAEADSGYVLEEWYVDGAAIEHTSLTYTTAALSSDVTVEARFAAITNIPVQYGVNDPDMGTITAAADGHDFQSGAPLSGGQKIVFTVVPAEGYRVKDWTGLPSDAEISADKTTATVPALTDGIWNVTANLEAIPQYTITIEDTTHGSIAASVDGEPLPSGSTVPEGTQVTFTAEADDYWMFQAWTGDASGSNKTITLTVSGNITVGATFTEALLYEVKYSVTGGNGTASGTYEETAIAIDTVVQFAGGSQLQFTAVPDTNYMVKAWTINGKTVEGNLSNTMTIDSISESTVVTVEFEAYQGFEIPANGNGYTVTIDQRDPAETYSGAPETEIRRGGNVTFTVVPEMDSAIRTITVAREDAEITPNGDGSVTISISNVQENIDLKVEVLAGVSLTIYAAENGTVTVTRNGVALESGVKVLAGDELTITATPDGGYQLDSLEVNGAPFASGGTITVTGDIAVAATFRVRSSGFNPVGPGAGDSYPADVPEDIPGGSILVNPDPAKAGETVTITPVPEDGHVLDSLAVTGPEGEEIHLGNHSNGTFSYTQPMGSVVIEAAFTCDRGESCPSGHFTDTAPDAWYHDALDYAVENGLMNGTSATTFDPNGTTTRAQIVTILYRLENEPAVAGGSPFTDVAAGIWYTDAATWAAANEIVGGYGGGVFGPKDPVTREQLAAILYRYARYKGYDVSIGADTSILGYADFADLSRYAIPAMQWACGAGIVNGTGRSTLTPQGEATRAQVAAMLQRFCQKVAE